jgi:hypothetical protein
LDFDWENGSEKERERKMTKEALDAIKNEQ